MIDISTDPNTLDFSLDATGDLQTTTEVVKQDLWKVIVMPSGNFVFDTSLGSYLYKIPQFGNTRASRELAKAYIRLAAQEAIDADRLEITDIEVGEITAMGASYRITFRDRTDPDTEDTLELF